MEVEASPLLLTRGLAFTYQNGTTVLRDVNLEVPTGSRVSVIGPSGCGKSTLLALCAGLYSQTSGDVVRYVDEDAGHPLSMMFQKETLLPWLSVEDNVMLSTRFSRGQRRSESNRRHAMELLELVGLQDVAKRYPYQLSGGMRRRVQLLSVVFPRPRLLLLDEPFSSLDEPTRIGVHRDVLRITEEYGITMVLVTHDLAEAITLSDKIVILTKRPATIYRERTVPFGADRDVLGLREEDRYHELYATVWHELSLQMTAGDAKSGGGAL